MVVSILILGIIVYYILFGYLIRECYFNIIILLWILNLFLSFSLFYVFIIIVLNCLIMNLMYIL